MYKGPVAEGSMLEETQEGPESEVVHGVSKADKMSRRHTLHKSSL